MLACKCWQTILKVSPHTPLLLYVTFHQYVQPNMYMPTPKTVHAMLLCCNSQNSHMTVPTHSHVTILGVAALYHSIIWSLMFSQPVLGIPLVWAWPPLQLTTLFRATGQFLSKWQHCLGQQVSSYPSDNIVWGSRSVPIPVTTLFRAAGQFLSKWQHCLGQQVSSYPSDNTV